jgi:hypothetical protein
MQHEVEHSTAQCMLQMPSALESPQIIDVGGAVRVQGHVAAAGVHSMQAAHATCSTIERRPQEGHVYAQGPDAAARIS